MALPMGPSGAIRAMRIGWSAVRMGSGLAKPLHECQRRRGRPNLRAIDHEDVSVAAAITDLARPPRETVKRFGLVASRDILAHSLQASVSKIRGVRVDGWIIVGIVEHDGDVSGPA